MKSTRFNTLGGVILACGFAAPAVAQTPTPPSVVSSASLGQGLRQFGEATYQSLFARAVHLTFAPVAPGGGLTVGVGAKPEAWKQHRLGVEMRGSLSTKRYWLGETDVWWQQFNTFRIEGFARARKMPQLDFYGLGASSLKGSRTDFGLLERTGGVTGWFRPVCQFAVGGRSEGMWPTIASGTSKKVSSLETRFSEASAPGFTTQPSFLHLQGFANLNYPCGEF
jgi:hypothetical protein